MHDEKEKAGMLSVRLAVKSGLRLKMFDTDSKTLRNAAYLKRIDVQLRRASRHSTASSFTVLAAISTLISINTVSTAITRMIPNALSQPHFPLV